MQALRLLASAPIPAKRLLHEVEKEIWKDDPRLAPVDRIAYRDEPIAVVNERNDRIAVTLLLAPHILLGIAQTQDLMHALKRFIRCGDPRTRPRVLIADTASLVFLAAAARAGIISANLRRQNTLHLRKLRC